MSKTTRRSPPTPPIRLCLAVYRGGGEGGGGEGDGGRVVRVRIAG
jgi:hypothetical protein